MDQSAPVFANFGCRLNAYETHAIEEMAAAAGLGDAVVVNTCAVTSEAVRKARAEIRRLARTHPGARVIVTGCAAQTEPDTFAAMQEVDLVLGNTEKMDPATWVRAAEFRPDTERVQVDDIMAVTETAGHLIDGFGTRGRGFNEVVLTGVDLTSWGADLPGTPRLGDLVRRILKLTDIPRLRISSIDSIEADEALMEAIATEARLMPHLHLSLQSGDDMILKRMKRRHLRDDAVAFCETARSLRPDMIFGADIIAGFPTETEAMFGNSLKLVEDCGLTWLHVFPYSPRPGTPAARMPQVDGRSIKARAARLRDAGTAAVTRHLAAQIGRRHRVLTESPGMGRTEHFAEVRFAAPQREGEIVTVTIAGHADGRLTA